MCDTLVALKNSTSDGSVILAKNSDREPNEGHALLIFPRQQHDPGIDMAHCTYMDVPQVEETYAVVLSVPHWMFGCEMGANEHGVAIGNEAVFTKEPERETGLLGMDMMRLALERSKTAAEALDTIVPLLETYGQGGACGFEDKKMKYHNSFLIADLDEAWVLETADRFWIAERVTGVRTISNCLTIGSHYDRIHPEMVSHAIEKGYCESESDFNFREAFTSGVLDVRTWGGKGLKRHISTTEELRAHRGDIDVPFMMKMLRTHTFEESSARGWVPSKGGMDCICIHAKPIFVPSQTTASYVGHLLPELQTHWFTATAAPCTSLFKPLFFESRLPDLGPVPRGTYDSQAIWWRHELVHRKILTDYRSRIEVIRDDQGRFESEYLRRVSRVRSDLNSGTPAADRGILLRRITEEAFNEASRLESEWLRRIDETPVCEKPGIVYRWYWDGVNKRAKVPV